MVIVVRKDLNMRKGKMIAQGGHAVEEIVHEIVSFAHQIGDYATHPHVEAFEEWRTTGRTKIAVGVDSEYDLKIAYQRAIDAGMPAAMVTDAGHTEFKGVPTNTVVAIGPWKEEEIDKITGGLKLL